MIFLQYTPKKNKKGSVISLLFMILGGMGLAFSVTAELRYSLFVQLISLFLFILSFEFFYRYEMTTYSYVFDEKDFIVIKSVGKKQTYVCNLSMSTALAIVPTPKKNKERVALEKQYGKIGIRYNLTQVMRPNSPYSILFFFNDKTAEIVFEPNDKMVNALKGRISENDTAEF